VPAPLPPQGAAGPTVPASAIPVHPVNHWLMQFMPQRSEAPGAFMESTERRSTFSGFPAPTPGAAGVAFPSAQDLCHAKDVTEG
jgi:hypothetical protein